MFFYQQKVYKMAISQEKSKRTVTGGIYVDHRGKKKYELGRSPRNTKVGEKRIKNFRGLGGDLKVTLLSSDEANVIDGKTHKKVKIKEVLENTANRHFVRRNIITKGAVIDTEVGKAKVVSRPGQEGTIDAILIK
jgi:small subunit ribosomal protein S8e